MIQNQKVLAIIPARGGSKGIPNKNISEVAGKPLIQYTIDAALKSKYIDKIFVSTDDEKIAAVSNLCGVKVEQLRPKCLAEDDTKTIDVLVHTISLLESQGEKYDLLLLLQPTQPLRNSVHIDEALETFTNSNAKSLVSVSPVQEHPILMRTINKEGRLKQLISTNSTVRRQEFQEYYIVNGAIYINYINEEFNYSVSLNDNDFPFVMDKKFNLDIDEPFDLQLLELSLRLGKLDKDK